MSEDNCNYVDCDFCSGTGYVYETNVPRSLAYAICNKCHGTGTLNWIELIFGKLGDSKKYRNSPEFKERNVEFEMNVGSLSEYNSYVKQVQKNWNTY